MEHDKRCVLAPGAVCMALEYERALTAARQCHR